MKPTVVILAAGMGSRYGGLKQVAPVGPAGETIMDYSVYDAHRAGFGRVVFVIRRDFASFFHEKLGQKYMDAIEVAYAFQETHDLPDGFAAPPDREKPWGTAHAARAARKAVHTRFAVINADDFYGADAFRRLAEFLARDATAETLPRHAMVGYRLDRTLSDHGTVARGICEVTPDGRLRTVREMTRLARVAGGVENREDPDHPVLLTGAERVSLNCWGFDLSLFDELEQRFPRWLAGPGAKPGAEWYLPAVVDAIIREGRAETLLLPTESLWHGVTYREDRRAVETAILDMIAAGEYPAQLW